MATSARRVIAFATEVGDVEARATAEMDLIVARACARVAVERLHVQLKRGEVDVGVAAEIGLVLAAVLDPTGRHHPDGVMVNPRALPYHRPDVPETVSKTEVPPSAHAPTATHGIATHG
jgi:hypothetical protein